MSPSAPADPIQPSFKYDRPHCWHRSRAKHFWLLPVWSEALPALFRTQPFPLALSAPSESCAPPSARVFKTQQADCPAPLQILPGLLTSVTVRSQLPGSSRLSPTHKHECSTGHIQHAKNILREINLIKYNFNHSYSWTCGLTEF